MLFIHSLLSSYALTLWLCCLLSCWLCDHFTMIIYIHIASFVWSFSAMMGAEYYFRQNNIYDWVSFGNWTECEDGSIRRKWCWWWRRRGRRIVLRLLFIFLCTYKITLLAAKERERETEYMNVVNCGFAICEAEIIIRLKPFYMNMKYYSFHYHWQNLWSLAAICHGMFILFSFSVFLSVAFHWQWLVMWPAVPQTTTEKKNSA